MSVVCASACPILQEPALRLLGIMLKYGPWRDAMVHAWRSIQEQQGFHGSDVGGRARILTETLRLMCKDMAGVDDTPWSESLGRNISHATGPLATLARLGILTKRKQHLHACRLQVGHTSAVRWLCSGVLAITQARSKVARWVRLADACQVRAPRTCKEWVSEHDRVNQVFEAHRIFKNKSYMRNFVIRGVMLAAMAMVDISRLSGAENIDAKFFASAFPDQRCWVRALSTNRCATLADFVDGLGYDGRPELLTMFLCLFLAKPMQVSPAWLLAHRTRLRRSMVSQHGRHGLFRLPGLCVQSIT